MKESSPGKVERDQAAGTESRGNGLMSRGAFTVAALVIVLAVIVFYARQRWLAVITVAMIDGGMTAIWIICAKAMGAVVIRPIRARATGAFQFATEVGLGMGVMGLLALGLGLAGVLNFGTALAILLAGPVLCFKQWSAWLAAKRNIQVGEWFGKPMGARWLLIMAAPLLGMSIVGASITPGLLWKPADPHPYDALEYHLQVPREWYENGRIEGLHHNVYSYFPFGVEMHYLMAMHLRGGTWNAMYQCQYLSIAWTLLLAAAVYGAIANDSDEQVPGDEMNRLRILGCAAAVLVVSTPWTIMLAAVAYTETALAFYTVLTVAWVLKSLRVERNYGFILVGGLMAGLACGVKYTAIPMVVAVMTGNLAIMGIATRRRRWWKEAAIFVLVAIAVAAPWLVRNAVWTGNPVFPLAMKVLGPGHFDAVQVKRFEIAHAAPALDAPMANRIRQAKTEIFANWQYGYVLWPMGALAIVIGWRSRAIWMIALFLVGVAVIWVGFTHLIGRFYFLAVPVAALAIGQVGWRRWPVLAVCAAGVAVVIGIGLVHEPLERFAELARNGFFGLDDLGFFNPPELADIDQSRSEVYLIGDAEGFLYRFPSQRLHYRTVFDIPGNATDMYQAWTGKPMDQLHGTLVINPMEVERLSHTYYQVPNLPPDWTGARDHTVIVRR